MRSVHRIERQSRCVCLLTFEHDHVPRCANSGAPSRIVELVVVDERDPYDVIRADYEVQGSQVRGIKRDLALPHASIDEGMLDCGVSTETMRR